MLLLGSRPGRLHELMNNKELAEHDHIRDVIRALLVESHVPGKDSQILKTVICACIAIGREHGTVKLESSSVLIMKIWDIQLVCHNARDHSKTSK